MKTLVVTGGIGSGKSVVCGMLSERGIPVYDSDSRTRLLYEKYPELVSELERMFDTELLTPDSGLDRKKLASIVFGNSENLLKLESVVHPYVLRDFLSWRDSVPEDVPYVIFESAIFMQKPLFHDIADKILLIDAPRELRLSRVCERDHSDTFQVEMRMESQSSDPGCADAVIVNDGGVDELKKKLLITIDKIW